MASCGQEVGDQAPMAATPVGLGTHEARRRLVERDGERFLPCGQGHAGRVVPESRDPDAVEPLFSRLAASPPTELDGVTVGDAPVGEGARERRLVELRVALRAREPSHVDERLRACLPDRLDELLSGPCSVSDGQEPHAESNPIPASYLDPMRVSLLALFAVLALSACGSSSSESGTTGQAAAGQAISISETEFKLDPSSVQVDQAGTVTFRVTNDGAVDHALEVEGQGVEEETETIKPGESAELTVDLSKEGSYEIYCPIDGHRDSGMEGTLTVGAAMGGGSTGTTEDEGSTTSDDDGYGYGSG
jgi:uncharacterized cupredoxin-like copper-binding protein